jgi:hypothetical protein
MYDLIGDIHGHADPLEQLLAKLGYQRILGVYRHPERKVIFLGDFIDRGPRIRDVLEIARSMVLEGSALAVMGNHEFNALAFHTEDPDSPGQYLRKRLDKNIHQHHQTLNQLSSEEMKHYLEWFRTLPMWLELPGLRAVHACWDPRSTEIVSRGYATHGGLTTPMLTAASRKGHELFQHAEYLLKGKELMLPKGVTFADKEGIPRDNIRTKWYLPPHGHTYRTYALQTDVVESDLPLHESIHDFASPYPEMEKPVFVGHYWLLAEKPGTLAPNVACLDYSVAKDGFLCAYRWSGEQQLSNDNFVWVTHG